MKYSLVMTPTPCRLAGCIVSNRPAYSCARAVHLKVKGIGLKVWVLVIVLLTRLEQQRFTISEVVADWHELMIPWRIMRPSIARDGERRAAHRHTTAPISALGLHHVTRDLLLISRPAEGRRLSWPEHTVS